jgi:hypothetical protein
MGLKKIEKPGQTATKTYYCTQISFGDTSMSQARDFGQLGSVVFKRNECPLKGDIVVTRRPVKRIILWRAAGAPTASQQKLIS